MKKRNFVIFTFIIVSLKIAGQEKTVTDYSIESATMMIDLAKRAADGTMPSEKEWRELFATDGYRTALAEREDSLWWKQSIREAFLLVFDESKQTQVDSIVSLPLEKRDDQFFFIYNFNNMKNNIDRLHRFIHQTDFAKMFVKGNTLAKKYLPKQWRDIQPAFQKYYFVVWDPESRAWDGIFLDINSFYVEGKKGMIRLLGHEIHHQYFASILEKLYTKDTQDPALIAIYRMQNEGTADLINKLELPTKTLGGYDKEIVDLYNKDYLSSPNVLAELDSLTCGFLDGKLTQKQYGNARYCAHMDGHTTGDYMTFLIRRELGQKVVTDCLGDFPTFVRLYNVAAKKAGTYVFSDKFVKHIEEMTEKMK